MENHTMQYDTITRLTTAISQCKDPEEVALTTAESVKTAFNAKGCSVFLVDRETRELGLVASSGLSTEYLTKGPIHFMQTIREAKDAIPIAIYDVMDDPRIEYPEEAKKEGIASLLGVPIISHDKIIGALRIYTKTPWEFSFNDINLAQAVALICGMAMDMCRMYKGYKTSIEILKNMRGKDTYGTNKWTPYEGVPKSVDKSIREH
ncbi:GAF domain-containing protein [Desulfobacula toluolica]|uniref:Putative GAF sensor protein n=1 Tax=Desulfobacula toluolica (strain DSM 7467 / Tol2) TaxID=651182 RepID=K0NFQ5_DESTT|nr:GAF domain-containing protein [Desulfobacula toluolica]CCK79775.1 putative GAF sensor protein [Desulfobacula toluolica Tol2]